jgi:putative two-component system response regulator
MHKIVIVVDYMMPAPDGMEFTRIFRALPGKSDTPLLCRGALPGSFPIFTALEQVGKEFPTLAGEMSKVQAALSAFLE